MKDIFLKFMFNTPKSQKNFPNLHDKMNITQKNFKTGNKSWISFEKGSQCD